MEEAYTNEESREPIEANTEVEIPPPQLETAYSAQAELGQQNVPMQADGMEKEAFNQFIQQAQRAVEQTRQAEGERALQEQIRTIGLLDPSVKSIGDLMAMPNFAEFDARVRQGYSLTDAFKIVNFDALSQKRSAAAKQAALNALQGKNHLTPTAGGAGEDIIIPAETLEFYKAAFPEWSEKQILADYKKHR